MLITRPLKDEKYVEGTVLLLLCEVDMKQSCNMCKCCKKKSKAGLDFVHTELDCAIFVVC